MKILLLGDKHIENYETVLKFLNVDYDTLLNVKDVNEYDGLIIPGGIDVCPKFYHEEKDPTVKLADEDWDNLQIRYIKHFVDNKKKILGICRGMQLLNVYFNGSLIQNITTNIKHTWNSDHSDSFHEMNCFDGFIKELYGDKCRINSSHHQAIKKLGNGFKIIAKSNDEIIEAVEHSSLPIIGVQFHPERLTLEFKRDDCVDGLKVYKYFLDM